jgi:NAD(P)-dependent dehydrogenase (short-subunit alcohol dehydrogenase family)
LRVGRLAAVAAAAGAAFAAPRLVRHLRRIDLDGRVAVVTGGSRGLGLRVAEEMIRHGARVVIAARDPDELDAAERLLAATDGEVLPIRADVTVPEDAAVIVDAAVRRFGRLDVLVNNAGVITVGPLASMDLEDFEKQMQVHFWGPLRLIRAALPHLERSDAGRIVNVSSIGGRVAVPHLGPYSASKAALVGLSDVLRAELAPSGVKVTTVCPGLMRTGSHLHAELKGDRAKEASWFTASAVAPVLAMDAGRAAAKIVAACRRGDPYATFNVFSTLGVRAEGVAPGLVRHAMGVAARLLPAAGTDGGGEAVPGWRQPKAWLPGPLRELGDRAARENLETVGTGASATGRARA